jgi:thiamine kinase-like enzyme
MDDATLFPAADESQDIGANIARIVQLLEPRLGSPQGTPVPLDGGITNRNFRMRLGAGDYVIRLPGKDTDLLGIDREAECAANDLASSLGIAPRVAAFLNDPHCLVTVFVEGSPMADGDLAAAEGVSTAAVALRALHDSGKTIPSRFDSFAIVDEYAKTAVHRGAQLPDAFISARDRAAAIKARIAGAERLPVPCHNDLLAANFLRTGDGMVILDWEYAGMGDRYFDLANFAVNNGLDSGARSAFLRAYWGDEPSAGQMAALEEMTFMSDFREAMWGVVQGAVSDLDFDFAGYAAKHFERMGGHGAS